MIATRLLRKKSYQGLASVLRNYGISLINKAKGKHERLHLFRCGAPGSHFLLKLSKPLKKSLEWRGKPARILKDGHISSGVFPLKKNSPS